MIKSNQNVKGKYLCPYQAESRKKRKDRATRQMNTDLESEGEHGDSSHFANWGGQMNETGKPLPKFEKSVFNMKYLEQK